MERQQKCFSVKLDSDGCTHYFLSSSRIAEHKKKKNSKEKNVEQTPRKSSAEMKFDVLITMYASFFYYSFLYHDTCYCCSIS